MQAGCRSAQSALDFGVQVALDDAAPDSSGSLYGHAASDKQRPMTPPATLERQMTLTLRPQDGAC
jgi:hypothetical protein